MLAKLTIGEKNETSSICTLWHNMAQCTISLFPGSTLSQNDLSYLHVAQDCHVELVNVAVNFWSQLIL